MSLWDEIIGHEWAVEMLSSAIRLDRIAHAYLISGPSQVGKATLAKTLAQALNCTFDEKEKRPCGRCRSCTLIEASRHPDVMVVEGESSGRGRRMLKIDQIRDLQQALNLTATEARYKVAVLLDFDDANASASNAFLKTLEEPPSQVVVILTAREPDLLLPTIPSRCQQIALRQVPPAVIQEALEEKWDIERREAELLAHLADGRIGWAFRAVKDPEIREERRTRLVQLQDVFAMNRVDRFDMAARLSREPAELVDILRTWMSWWRDLAVVNVRGEFSADVVNLDDEERLSHLARKWETESIIRSLKQTDVAIWQLARNANTRLVVENLLLIYPHHEIQEGEMAVSRRD